jgi:hypothetical protein
MKKRVLIALMVGGVVFASVFGMAASLGVTTDSLGAGSADVNSCDNTVAVRYVTAYSTAPNGYKVTGVTVNGVNDTACNGHTLAVTLVDSTGASVGTASAAVATGTVNYTNLAVTGTPLASAVEDAHVIISSP